MATLDRFKEMLATGKLLEEQGGAPLVAQTKYDFLAAKNSMEMVEEVIATLEKRKEKRATTKQKFAETGKNALRRLIEEEDLTNIKKLDEAIKMLLTLKNEMIALEGETQAEKAIKKIVEGGVTAK